MSIKNLFIVSFAGMTLLGLTLSGQENSRALQVQQERLQQLQQEINEFQSQLQSAKQQEQSVLEQLNSIDKDLSYTQRLIDQMQRTQQERSRRIRSLNSRLESNQLKVQELRNRFADRAVHIYKQGSYNDLELLLTSQSMNQALYRYKYLKIINDADKKIFDILQETIDAIESDRVEVQQEMAQQERLLADKRQAQTRLTQRQRERKQVLSQLQSDQKKYADAIRDREAASRAVQEKITELQNSRSQKQRQQQLAEQRTSRGMTATVDIASLQGQLPWPTQGQIIARFGKFRHPKLKTITENTGIDIAAPKGTSVTAVLDGVVTTITWLRGYGSMIILDHGSGFYTVYTHVMDITVEQGQYVNTGDVIASVGDSGSLEGPKLHFEIYGNNEKMNPELWLAKPV
ncbi:MAG: peptidoglycan DD-metalloendopeptidase family protein [Candidatus Marinimicrobia bacterium]|nr:peptidoglycan DD-metalloendopeptidase family protein [Candidatus Neomarinimicrobiota bacterium]